MNQDEIIAMAKEAGGYESPRYIENLVMDKHDLTRFAALVAAREREACAQVCEKYGTSVTTKDCAAAIRERGTP